MSRDDSGFGLRVSVEAGLQRGKQISFTFDGKSVVAFEGETVATALLAAGHRALRTTKVNAASRGVFCGIGVCYDCMVVVDGKYGRLACKTDVHDGMRIQTQHSRVAP